MPTREIRINVTDETLRKLKLHLGASEPVTLCETALARFLVEDRALKVTDRILSEICSRVQCPPIRSEDDLLAAFEKGTHLDERCVVLTVDDAAVPQLEPVATGYGVSKAEALKMLVENAIAQGWWNDRIETKALLFRKEVWQSLAALAGEPIRNSEHLLSVVRKLVESSAARAEA